MPHPTAADREIRTGFLCGLGAYIVWGFLPLVFARIKGIGNIEIMAWRILAAALVLIVVVSLAGKWSGIATALRNRRTLMALTASSILVFINWLTYVIAVRSGHVLEASLGYFINPMVNIGLAVLFLGERLSAAQKIAVAIAAAGVVALAVDGGGAFWVSLVLAFSFGAYGLIRKLVAADALEGLAVETGLLIPLAIGLLSFGPTADSANYYPSNIFFLCVTGALTVLPLFLFAAAARRMPYSMLAWLQYLSPSIQFVIALSMGEAFRPIHAVTFGCIWCAVVISGIDAWRRRARAPQPVELV